MWLRNCLRPLPALLLFCAGSALALEGDTLTLRASYSRQTDSNLFRLPAGANVSALVGQPSAAEQIDSTSVSLSIAKPYGLQRLELDAGLTDYRYRNFSYLNLVASSYSAAWRWSLTPRWHGNFTSERKESLNSFVDARIYSVRNLRTSTSTRFDALYELDGSWRVVGGVTQTSQSDYVALTGQTSFSAATSNAGLLYAFASGSTLGYTLRNANGSYLNRDPSAASLFDNAYNELGSELRLHWLVSGNSTVDLGVTSFKRSHPNFSQRDYGGLNGFASLNWSLSGKSTLAAGLWHELSAYQTDDINYMRSDRLTLGPVWQISAQTTARLNHEVTLRDYQGSPRGLPPNPRVDITRSTGLTLDWQPHQRIVVSASLQKISRTANLDGYDFDSNAATLTAQLIY